MWNIFEEKTCHSQQLVLFIFLMSDWLNQTVCQLVLGYFVSRVQGIVFLFIWSCLRGVVANVLDCDIIVSMFELQPCYYVPFQTNALGKSMKPFYYPHHQWVKEYH